MVIFVAGWKACHTTYSAACDGVALASPVLLWIAVQTRSHELQRQWQRPMELRLGENAARWARLLAANNAPKFGARSGSPGDGLGQPAAEESLPAKCGQREGVCDAVCAGAELRLVVDQRYRRHSYRTKDVITLVRSPLRGGSRRTLLAAAAATSLNRLRFPRATTVGRFTWFLTAASATARLRLARIPNLPARIGRRHDCRQASRSDHYAQQKMGCGDSKHASVLVLVLVVGYLQSFRQKGAESSCGQQFPAERTQ